MPRYYLKISYDGADFCGWQWQPKQPSIAAQIEDALKILCKTPTRIVGASRTDSGVHALGQAAHFDAPFPLDLKKTQHSLNGLLPKTIRILEIQEVADDFHAQYHANYKVYHYHIRTDAVACPFKRHLSLHFPYPLCLNTLKQALPRLCGERDFQCFANQSHDGKEERSYTRNLKSITLHPYEGGFYLEFIGDGFLYKMVRNLVGLLLDIGQKKRPLSDIEVLFNSQDRTLASAAAAPHGLCLMHVDYDFKHEKGCTKTQKAPLSCLSA